jgi:hypothetical protein
MTKDISLVPRYIRVFRLIFKLLLRLYLGYFYSNFKGGGGG